MEKYKKTKQTHEMEHSSNMLHCLHKILTFLTSHDKSQVFPSLTMEMEDILVKIVKDTEYLKQGTFDDDCNNIVAEISAVLEKNKHAFTLSYGFDNNEVGKKVMVYQKISPVHVFKEPTVFKSLRRSNLALESNDSNPSLVMFRFKTNTLNATLKFVKNDAQLALQYPDMTTEQADYVKRMIAQCTEPHESNESGFKNLYDPLTEALKIFSLKYRFVLNAETYRDMKRLKFEKILKSTTEGREDLDSSISSISSTGNEQDGKNVTKNDQYLTNAIAKLDTVFIYKSINRLNEFLKDSTKDVLVFPDLNVHEKLFLKEWKVTLKRVEIIKMFNVEGQMVLDELRHSMDRINSGKFRLRVVTEMPSLYVRSVTFTKIYMTDKVVSHIPPCQSLRAVQKNASASFTNVKTAVTNVSTKSAAMLEHIQRGSNISSSSSEDEAAGSIAYNDKIELFIKKIKTLPQSWIRNTLTELKTFIQDEARGSLTIPGITNAQMEYLTKWQKMLRNTDIIEAYQPDVQLILWAIHRAVFVNAHKFKVTFNLTSVRKGQVRDITYIKTPCFPSLRTKAKPKKLKDNVNKTPVSSRASLQDTSSPTATPGLQKTPSATSLTLPRGKGRAAKKIKRPKSATETLRRTVAKKLPPAKLKLIEGLNQPVVSEKGLKMMRSMGWDGGALGIRGEGITEPIRLQLDMGRRAGLGSAKPPSRQPAVPVKTDLPLNITRVVVPYMPDKTEFKKGILRTILNMFSDKRPTTELLFPDPLTLKNWAFIKHHVTIFSNRERVSVDASPVNEMSRKILDIFRKTEFIISACWGTSKTNVLIILSSRLDQPTYIESSDWCCIANLDNASVRARESTAKSLSVNNSGTDTLEPERFRYYVLAQILDFCQQSNIDKGPLKGAIEKNILLKSILSRKQMAFVEDLIIRLNRKSRSCTNSEQDNVLFDKIKGEIEGHTLKVDFPMLGDSDANIPPGHKIIRLHKIFDAQNSENIHTTDKGTCDKIKILSMKSINDLSKNTTFDHIVRTNPQKVTKKDGSSPFETSKTLGEKNLNNTECCNKNAQNKTIDNDTKNVIDSQNTQKHYFDADDLNNCLCCYDDNEMEVEIEGENKVIDKHTVEYVFTEDESFYPIANMSRPLVVDDKQKDRPINTESVKESYRPIVAENDMENYMSLVTDSAKGNDMPIVSDSDRENDMPIVTDIDKENDRPIVTDIDKENDRPIVIDSDKENVMLIVTKSDIKHISKKHADILNTSTENIIGLQSINYNEYKIQDSVDDHIECELLNEIEFVKQIESKLKAHRIDRNEGNQECLYKNESGRKVNENFKETQLIDKTDKDLGKRLRSNGQTPERLSQKCRYPNFVKHVSITPKDYPQSKTTNKMAGEIQKSILKSIYAFTQELPLLKCHGIQEGALSYSCYSEKSLNLIENVVRLHHFQITVKQERHTHSRIKMAFRLNTYLDESVHTLLARLEMYNLSLNTKEWVVIKKEQYSDYVVIQVEMDYNSFKFIKDEKFWLYAGLDVAKFSTVWD